MSPRAAGAASVGAFVLTLALTTGLSLAATGGRFVYGLDDPYIHLALAQNLALHGTWGLEPGVFVSASSSPLWTALLAACVWVVGPGQAWVPGVLSVGASVAVLALAHHIWTRAGMDGRSQALLGVAVCLFTSLPALCSAGLEHPLHALLSLGLIHAVTGEVERPSAAGALAALCALTRFEGLFLVASLALVAASRRRWLLAVIIASSAGVAVGAFGLWSMSQGGEFLPNTLLIKGNNPASRPLWVWLTTWTGQLVRAPWLLGLLACVAVVRPHLEPDLRGRGDALMITSLLHVQLAQVGWFFRYEAYLVLLLLVTLGEAWARSPSVLQERALAVVGVLATLALVGRAGVILYATPRASADIRYQHLELARFLGDHFAGETVAIHDIGRVAFEEKVKVLDLYGLANDTVRAEKIAGTLTAERLRELVAASDAPVAVVYDSWFGPAVTDSWTHVGGWRFAHGWVCPDDTLSVYSTAPEHDARVRAAFQAFADTLEAPVEVVGP